MALGKNFKELCEDLKASPLRMNDAKIDALPSDSPLKGAYEYGYTSIPHLLTRLIVSSDMFISV